MLTAGILLVALVSSGAQAQAPANWDATYQRAQQLVLDGKYADAIATYQRVVRQSPDFDPARYALGDAFRMRALDRLVKGGTAAAARPDFEQAEAQFRQVWQRAGEYKPLAVVKLMSLYQEDELNRPADLVTMARDYVAFGPDSAVGHATLTKALVATGQEAQATTALLAARTAVRPDQARLLATIVVEHVIKATSTPPAQLKTLLDYAEQVIDRELRAEPESANLLMTKAAAAMFRADRLETNPARKRAAKAEADRIYERFHKANGSGLQTSADIVAPSAPGTAEPAGYSAARDDADRLITRRDFAGAARAYEDIIKSDPSFLPAHYLRIGALVMAGQTAAVDAALKAARTAVPTTAESQHMAAVYLFDLVNSNKDMAPGDARKLLIEADAAENDALKLRPVYFEAVVYKSVVLSARAKLETDPAVVKALKTEADRASARARELRAAK